MIQLSLDGRQFLFSEVTGLRHSPQTLHLRLDEVLAMRSGGHQPLQSVVVILDANMMTTQGVQIVFKFLDIL